VSAPWALWRRGRVGSDGLSWADAREYHDENRRYREKK
jgi:hypothetical protein